MCVVTTQENERKVRKRPRKRRKTCATIIAPFLLGGYQQPVYAGVCGVVCVCRKKKEKRKKKKNRKMKNRDSLARKSHFNQLCGGYQAKNSGGQFISLASC